MEEPVSFDAESIRTEKTKVLGAISVPDDLDDLRRARAVRPGLARRRPRCRATSTSRTSRRPPRPRPTPPSGWASRRGAGPVCRSTCAPASGCRGGSPRSRSSSRRRRTCRSTRPTPRSWAHNQLVIRVQPDEGITLRIGSKVPGSAMEVRDVSMDFLYGEAFTESSPEAYERLLLDVLLGDATLFPRNEEVELSWMVDRPARGVLGGHASRSSTAPASGARAQADDMLARDGRVWRRPCMSTTLWDTNGAEIVKALLRRAPRRRRARLRPRADARRGHRREATSPRPRAAATTAAAAHPCRVLIVVRRRLEADDRLDAEVQVGGRLGANEAVVMRMYGRLALHAESVVLPLLAPDAPVVTWWHEQPPEKLAYDALGVLADRRVTDCAPVDDPLDGAAARAKDYAPGDTDLAWTRATPWRVAAGRRRSTAARRRRRPREVHARARQRQRRADLRLARRPGSACASRVVESDGPGRHRGRGALRGRRAAAHRPAGRLPRDAVAHRPAGPAAAAEAARARRPASPRSCAGSTATSPTPRRWRRSPARRT